MNQLISIIIPFYNAIDYIEETIQSALNQSYSNYEIILVNDGEKYKLDDKLITNPKITYYVKENNGPSSARNYGLQKASGELIAFLDQDDLWHKDKLKLQVEALSNSSAGIVSCLSTVINQDNKIIAPNFGKVVNGDFYKGSLLCDPIGGGSVALVKKECFEDIGNFDEDIYGREDWDLWIRILRKYKISTINKPLVGYRRLPEGLSQKYSTMVDGGVKALKKVKEYDKNITDAEYNKYLLHHKLAIIRLCIRDGAYKTSWELLAKLIKEKPLSLISNLQIPLISMYLGLMSVIKSDKTKENIQQFIYKIVFRSKLNNNVSFS